MALERCNFALAARACQLSRKFNTDTVLMGRISRDTMHLFFLFLVSLLRKLLRDKATNNNRFTVSHYPSFAVPNHPARHPQGRPRRVVWVSTAFRSCCPRNLIRLLGLALTNKAGRDQHLYRALQPLEFPRQFVVTLRCRIEPVFRAFCGFRVACGLLVVLCLPFG